MTEFKISKFETFQVIERGTVFTVHRDDESIEEISSGDIVEIPDGTKWEVRDVECFRKSFNMLGSNVGLLVKQIKE